jgi:hypothetical protein
LPFVYSVEAEQHMSPQTQWAASKDWEDYRGPITRLYRDENRTLRETMRLMEEVYGFRAT